MKVCIYKGAPYREITHEEASAIINSGGYKKEVGFCKYSPLGKYLEPYPEDEVFVAIDNETGDAWTEQFYSKTVALNWLLFDSYGSTEDAHLVDERARSSSLARKNYKKVKS